MYLLEAWYERPRMDVGGGRMTKIMSYPYTLTEIALSDRETIRV